MLVPIFFVLMGLKVDLRLFTRVDILGFALALTLAAIIGKQVCALGVVERGVNRLAVGLGMIPRGEVGLIFAGIGATLMLPSVDRREQPVISSAVFGAVVIMVIITTLITPLAMKWALGKRAVARANGRVRPWEQGRISTKLARPQKPRGQQTGFAGNPDQNREEMENTPALRGRRKKTNKMFADASEQHMEAIRLTPAQTTLRLSST